MKIGGSEILQMGEPMLRKVSAPIDDLGSKTFRQEERLLHRALRDFRREYGFGRAIAAPQIGMNRRIIALNLGAGPLTMVNPNITWRSAESFEMWDDCMSFPNLLVRLTRHRNIRLTFTDGTGAVQTWDDVSQDISELLQHEIDHLDGTLAVDRAKAFADVVTREAFERNRSHYVAGIAYAIPAGGRPGLTSAHSRVGSAASLKQVRARAV